MPLDALPYADLMERLGFIPANHREAQLFAAETRPVYDERGQEVADFRRIVRTDNDKTLEVVGANYAFVDHRTLFEQFERAIAKSGLDASGMVIGTDYANEGRRVFRQYVFPAHCFSVKEGVPLAFRMIMQNSLDGSSKVSGRAGFFSFVCANGAIIGTNVGAFALRHQGEIDLRAAIAELVAGADYHIKQQDRLREWPRIGVTDRKALDLINSMTKASKAQKDHLVHAYNWARLDDGPQGGANLWALSAVLTAWPPTATTPRAGWPGRKRGAHPCRPRCAPSGRNRSPRCSSARNGGNSKPPEPRPRPASPRASNGRGRRR